jgi:hypothetical protein
MSACRDTTDLGEKSQIADLSLVSLADAISGAQYVC